MINIHPIKLYGNWSNGYALDVHTISSEFVGYDEYGHEAFDTKRSEIGELLYKLKYKSDRSCLSAIVDVVVAFIAGQWKIAGLVAVPPSKTSRAFQPVVEIAENVSSRLQFLCPDDYLVKLKETPELKGVYEYSRRLELLENVFGVKSALFDGKNVLLFDDLYRSGATLNAITRVLYEQGGVSDVYVLTLTKTRSKS